MPAGAPSLLGRQGRLSPLCVLTNAEAFERAMAQPWLAKTPHFAVHHLAGGLMPRRGAAPRPGLSSMTAQPTDEPVDNSIENPVDKRLDEPLQAAWAGYVVPKRHARRAVTRNLIRRQMRQALADQQGSSQGLPAGVWVLRLRQGFDRAQFPSAASQPLKRAVRDELLHLVGHAVRRLQERSQRP
ncbi:MAG: hypothetical protein EBS47_04320 [Betaproteobacteria bacterium]|nr:hypothetical protein [Betaproteobacteria bacterium]NBT09665.1 hypothetical protein [Betaproteobacteria bacterium]NBU49324.1 hypothetical protein [Betaproteobacteria bacterium]NBX96169.1 hypothetical protein [Betaproteobacteria bacterium]